MIVTVTMNPALDKTVELDVFRHKELNRLKNIVTDAGGKGINVSKTIRQLGGNSVATGFLGGNTGLAMENMLKEEGIQTDFIFVPGETRTNMKVIEPGGVLTELNEPGPSIPEEAIEQLIEKIDGYATKDTLFILAGSIPTGMDSGIYRRIIEKVKLKKAKVFLDADGELFAKAMEAVPDIIKPNQFELEQFSNRPCNTEEELIEMGKVLQKKGVKVIAVSMGREGALFILEDKVIRAPGLKVKAHSTVGAGDAMVAALSYGIDSQMDMEECIRLGMAASAGAVITQGTKPPSQELVEKLKEQVITIQI